MNRYARGGGPVLSGASSAETVKTATAVEDTAHDTPDQQDSSHLRRRLPRCDLRAVPEIRRAMRDLLAQWGRPGRSETAELLTSEIVTNALVHTDREAVVTATVGPRGLHVEVRDFEARRPRLRVPDVRDGTHGRGLVLVQSLADAWGVRVHGVGKAVWFELDGGAA
ncbi:MULTISPECIES: ATP-binding protein [Streptomyces]|uniref:ATP-binding protein n=1 Tax=Streptomyces apricus TaxID=1828112 RepID=A0A5B0BHM1_9ACTN|nr:ATP-binding protein [Streptomyces apricus]